MKRRWVLGLAVTLTWLTADNALAQVTCGDAAKMPNPVYILSGDTQVPVLKALGAQLRSQASPITIVWIASGSCTNLANMYTGKFTGGVVSYIPTPADDPTFDPATSVVPTCTNPNTLVPDIGISIVFPDLTNCPSAGTRPATQGLYPGPVQAFLFAVPALSAQVAITAEEAYLVFGLGPVNGAVSPWLDASFLYGRPPTKGTQIGIGANIGVPAAKWQLLNDTSHRVDQSSVLAASLASHNTDGNADKTLGILGTEIYDLAANRTQLKSLAFRAFKQLRAYWPDSAPTAFDKKNVRDGHYPLWSYVQYVAPKDAGGLPSKPESKLIIDALSGNAVTTNPVFEPLTQVVANGLVPPCAMKVQRSVEGGPLSPYDAPEPCACFFEKNVSSGSTSCTACSLAAPCASGTCRHGYCEAK